MQKSINQNKFFEHFQPFIESNVHKRVSRTAGLENVLTKRCEKIKLVMRDTDFMMAA